jgi:hypothetical protein
MDRDTISLLADIVTLGTPVVTLIYYICIAKNHSNAKKSGSVDK